MGEWRSGDTGRRPGGGGRGGRGVRGAGHSREQRGVNLRPPLGELGEDVWDTTMSLNLEAPHLLSRRFGPGMAERGFGRIIHITSQQAHRAFAQSGAYGVSKGALESLARSQAEAWSPHGVTCNTLVPGFVLTPLNERLASDPEMVKALAARTPDRPQRPRRGLRGRDRVPGEPRLGVRHRAVVVRGRWILGALRPVGNGVVTAAPRDLEDVTRTRPPRSPGAKPDHRMPRPMTTSALTPWTSSMSAGVRTSVGCPRPRCGRCGGRGGVRGVSGPTRGRSGRVGVRRRRGCARTGRRGR